MAASEPTDGERVDSSAGPDETHRAGRVREVAAVFLKLGVIGFGGPAAHIALMRDEVVRRRRWLDDREFLEWVGACNVIPGPNSTELAIQLGSRRAGVRGLMAAGACFIGPAVVLVGALAWLYERYGTDSVVVDVRYGILPVVVAVVLHAVFGLGRVALVDLARVLVAAGALAAFLLDVHELLILGAAGAVSVIWATRGRLHGRSPFVAIPVVVAAATEHAVVSLWRLFLVFLEIGSVLYGSGYVLFAFLQRNLVEHLGWLTNRQLLDAVAVGQITPGPLFSSATFVGWQVDGVAGAAVATAAIFLPAFLFVAALGRIVPWMRRTPMAKAFLDGVTAASLGLMAGVLVELAGPAFPDVATVGIAVAALAALVVTRVSSGWVVLGGFAIGALHAVAG